jgi:ketol-acid reductoisomerase
MAVIYYDSDASLQPLEGKTVAVIGYGSQGHAHAQNLRDSGVKVVVGLRKGSRSWERVQADGLTPMEIPDAVRQADVIALMVPDTEMPALYREQVAPHSAGRRGTAFCAWLQHPLPPNRPTLDR